MNPKLTLPLLVLALALMACGPINEAMSNVEETLDATTIEAPDTNEPAEKPTDEPTAIHPTTMPDMGDLVRQWAVAATASSEYGTSDWSAMQATGAPDTPQCGDYITAWASATAEGEEWLELTYDTPVKPTEVHIIQTYNPNQVVKVELIDVDATYHEIYDREPEPSDECPYVLSIPMVDTDYVVTGIRITIDQSVILDWNEIDAVELVGYASE